MNKISLFVTAALSMSLGITAESLSIGSVISQGDLKIDNHSAQVSGTIFDGSVVETGHGERSSADVRLANGAKLTLYGDSRGALYRDHFVLLSGQVQLAASTSFRTEVSGLVIASTGAGSRGVVSVGPNGSINVFVETGAFQVTKNGGDFLTQIGPNKQMAFSRSEDGRWRLDGDAGHDFDGDRDHHHCYVDAGDDRDCEHHHHHHPSR
jgi:hypothetical protein